METNRTDNFVFDPENPAAHAGLAEFYDFQTLFESSKDKPEEVVSSLGRFGEVLLGFQSLYSWEPLSQGFVSTAGITRAFVPAAARVISHNPGYLDEFSALYQKLDAGPKTIPYRGYYETLYKTPAAKFIDRSKEVFGLLADQNYANRAGLVAEDISSAVLLANRLTDCGIIESNFWYQKAVRRATSRPSFPFVENLHERLTNGEAENPPGGPSHGRYYVDAYRFVNSVLSGMVQDPERHQKNATIIAELVAKDKNNGLPTLPSVVGAANTVGRLINKSGDLNQLAPQGEVVMLQDLDPHALSSLPPALLRLLYITRIKGESAAADRQAYEDSVYTEVLSWVTNMAAQKHEQWYTGAALKSLADMRVLYPRASRSQLNELRSRVHLRDTRGVWSRWKPGYGKLT